MVLNGDILDYENVGPIIGEGIEGSIDDDLFFAFLYFVDYVWQRYAVLRLSGGGKKRGWQERLESATSSLEKKYKSVRDLGISTTKSMLETLNAIKRGNDYFRSFGVEYSPTTQAGIESAHSALQRISDVISASPERVFPSIDQVRIGPMTVRNPRIAWYNEDNPMIGQVDEKGIVMYNPGATHVDQSNNQMSSGAGVLALKNSLTKRLRSHCIYYMSPLLWTKVAASVPDNLLNHQTEAGSGPHLYMTYNLTTQANTRSQTFNLPNNWDQGMETATTKYKDRGVGWSNIVYIFAADYPFLTMNHDKKTQDSTKGEYGHYLSWKYVTYGVTTETNPPLQLVDFVKTRDWQYLTHYHTDYTFDLMNTSLNTYIVEIMFFKFKADPDAMNYLQQVTSVSRRQSSLVQQWIYGVNELPVDISIVHRKRIALGPNCVSNYWKGVNVNTGMGMANNVSQYKFRLSREYVMKRPVMDMYEAVSENEFFNTYYEPHKGVYCRIQAFTFDALRSTKGVDFTNVWYNDEDVLNNPTEAKDGTISNGKGVSCRMEKVSYFKLDENLYKSYIQHS